MSSFDPVILIHGAWAGAWVWDRLTPPLRSAGLETIAIDLPGNGADGSDPALVTFESYLEHLHAATADLPAPFSLVAHSGGGNVASAYAERWRNRPLTLPPNWFVRMPEIDAECTVNAWNLRDDQKEETG